MSLINYLILFVIIFFAPCKTKKTKLVAFKESMIKRRKNYKVKTGI